MPIYEYRCSRCRHKTSVFVRSFSQEVAPVCSHCGSASLQRLISAFAVLKSEESRLEDLASPEKWGDVDEQDPRSMAKWMRKMRGALGEDVGPEFDEMVEQMEAGEPPEDEADLESGEIHEEEL